MVITTLGPRAKRSAACAIQQHVMTSLWSTGSYLLDPKPTNRPVETEHDNIS